MKKIFYVFIAIACLSCNSIPKKDKTGTATYKNEAIANEYNDMQIEIKKDLKVSRIHLLGEIATNVNTWYIIEGEISEPTYTDNGIYIYPKSKDGLADSIFKNRFSYPGKEFSFDSLLVYESRVFFGRCTDKYDNNIIWYQRELVDDKWDISWFIIDFNGIVPLLKHIDKSEIDLNEILGNVGKHFCEEIFGKVKYDEP
ncbi:MAG: hypothetical protein ACOWWR_18705 [Eubacteriales bacterium]